MNYNYSLHGHVVLGSTGPVQVGSGPTGQEWLNAGDVGVRQVWGTEYNGEVNSFKWFQIPCLIPGSVAGDSLAISKLEIRLKVMGKAHMERVHISDHAFNDLFGETDLCVIRGYKRDFATPLALHGGFLVYVGIRFEEQARVEFRGTNISLLVTARAGLGGDKTGRNLR